MSAPSKRIRPDDGGSAPATMLKMVVFPAPLGPMIPVIRPASIRNEHPLTAVRPPKRRVRSSTARIGAGAVVDEGDRVTFVSMLRPILAFRPVRFPPGRPLEWVACPDR